MACGGQMRGSLKRGFALSWFAWSEYLTIARARGFTRLANKGFWAVLDQGLFAVSNFVLNVLLARWLAPQDYGAFTLAFSVLLLLGTFHSALLIEPMLIFGPGRYKERLSEYLGVLVYGHWRLAVPVGSILLLGTSVILGLMGSGMLSVAFLGLALAGPLICFLWLVRRACYARLEPRLAALGGALYMVLMVAGAFALYRGGWLSTSSALAVMGLSSLVVAMWFVKRLGVSYASARGRDGLGRDALRRHWDYGRWAVLTSALTWVPGNVYYVLLPAWGGLEAGASLKALMNLVMPMLQANAALSVILLPLLVQARGGAGFGRLVRLSLACFSLGSLLYWLLLGLFNRPLVELLYGGQYSDHAGLLWFIGLMPLVSGIGIVLGGALRAMERPDRVFWAYMLSTVTALTAGLGLMVFWGLEGTIAGLMFAYVVTAVAMYACYLRTTDPLEDKEDHG
jgi:O-antigen/teichoic acid export membrane protein